MTTARQPTGMSDIVEKTLASLPSLITGGLSPGAGGANTSRGFQIFVKTLSNTKTKYEEDLLMKREVALLKQRLTQPGISMGQMKEYMVRLVYCDMLGYDISFAYIHAVKLAQQGALLEKRVGYLATSLFLNENHELVVLLMNTIQRDLKSTNIVEVCIALTAVCQLISTEMIPALLPLIEEKLLHPKEIVRKKAVMCLHKFLTKAPNLVQHIHHKFKKALCDRDPGVMWASLHIYYDLLKDDVTKHKDVAKSLVGILQQVINRKLPPEFEYHSVPAPWLQIQILKMLAMLGAEDESVSELIYPVLSDILQRTDTTHKIGLAVIYEALATITTIYPHEELVEHAAKCIGKFLRAKSNNLRYLGVKALAGVVQVSPHYAVENQDVVLECLDDADHTIRRQTLDLLYKMTNRRNVKVICKRMTDYLNRTTDEYQRMDIVNKISELAERFAPNVEWYIDTMNNLMLLAGSLVPTNTTQKLLTLIEQGSENDDTDQAIKLYAVKAYVHLLRTQELPDSLVQIGSWVLGEYHHLAPNVKSQEAIAILMMYFRNPSLSDITRSRLVSAMMKLSVEGDTGSLLQDVFAWKTDNSDLKQRITELNRLLAARSTLERIWMMDRNLIDLQFDFSLSFLDNYVSDMLEQGIPPYRPHSIRYPEVGKAQEASSIFAGLNFKPYDSPVAPSVQSQSTPLSISRKDQSNLSQSSGTGSQELLGESGLKMKGVKKVWGKEGIVEEKKTLKNPRLGEVDRLTVQHKQDMDMSQDSLDLEKDAEVDLSVSPETRGKQELASALFTGLEDKAEMTTSGLFKTKTKGGATSNATKTSAAKENKNEPLDKQPKKAENTILGSAIEKNVAALDDLKNALVDPKRPRIHSRTVSDSEHVYGGGVLQRSLECVPPAVHGRTASESDSLYGDVFLRPLDGLMDRPRSAPSDSTLQKAMGSPDNRKMRLDLKPLFPPSSPRITLSQSMYDSIAEKPGTSQLSRSLYELHSGGRNEGKTTTSMYENIGELGIEKGAQCDNSEFVYGSSMTNKLSDVEQRQGTNSSSSGSSMYVDVTESFGHLLVKDGNDSSCVDTVMSGIPFASGAGNGSAIGNGSRNGSVIDSGSGSGNGFGNGSGNTSSEIGNLGSDSMWMYGDLTGPGVPDITIDNAETFNPSMHLGSSSAALIKRQRNDSEMSHDTLDNYETKNDSDFDGKTIISDKVGETVMVEIDKKVEYHETKTLLERERQDSDFSTDTLDDEGAPTTFIMDDLSYDMEEEEDVSMTTVSTDTLQYEVARQPVLADPFDSPEKRYENESSSSTGDVAMGTNHLATVAKAVRSNRLRMQRLEMSMEEFGEMWKILGAGLKKEVLWEGRLEDFVRIVTEKLEICCLKIIGSEAILAAVAMESAAPCLVHCKLKGVTLEIWAKSSDVSLAEAVSSSLLDISLRIH